MKIYLKLLEESLPAPDHPRYAAWRAYALSGEERVVPIVNRQQQFKELATARVLDLGCGDGGLTVELAIEGAEVVAIHINPQCVVRTRARLEYRNVVATVVLASAQSLPFASSSIDVVVAQDVIEHIRDPIGVLQEVNRVLRADGLCLISAPNGRAWSKHHI